VLMDTTSLLRFVGTQTLAKGTIEFIGTGCSIQIRSGAVVTFAPPVLVHGRSGTIQDVGTLINQGKISADVAGGQIAIEPANWTHNGTAEVLNGGQLTFAGAWDGTGSVDVTNGRLNLAGQFGPITTPISKGPAGTVQIVGTADLQGGSLTLN